MSTLIITSYNYPYLLVFAFQSCWKRMKTVLIKINNPLPCEWNQILHHTVAQGYIVFTSHLPGESINSALLDLKKHTFWYCHGFSRTSGRKADVGWNWNCPLLYILPLLPSPSRVVCVCDHLYNTTKFMLKSGKWAVNFNVLYCNHTWVVSALGEQPNPVRNVNWKGLEILKM